MAAGVELSLLPGFRRGLLEENYFSICTYNHPPAFLRFPHLFLSPFPPRKVSLFCKAIIKKKKKKNSLSLYPLDKKKKKYGSCIIKKTNPQKTNGHVVSGDILVKILSENGLEALLLLLYIIL